MSRLWGQARRAGRAIKQQPMNDGIVLAIAAGACAFLGLISSLWGLPE